MSSFIEKLNKRGVGNASAEKVLAAPQTSAPQDASALQVDIDMQQSLAEIVICAPLGGVGIADLHITVEGEDDVIVIQGERKKPEVLTAKGEGSMKAGETAMYLQRECKWGTFFRKVFLPVEIDPSRAQVTFGKGMLILVLPFKQAVSGAGNGIPLQVTEVP